MAIGLWTLAWPKQLEGSLPRWLHPHKGEPSERELRHKAQKVKERTYDAKLWRMTIQTDGFTGQVRCRLMKMKTLTEGRITYAQKTFGFEMGENVNTLNAWYSIDNRPAKRWQTLSPVLAANRVSLEGASLENPTGGVVLLPEAEIGNARVVTIRANEKSQPREFKLKGFESAVAAARYNGCAADTSFERGKW
ncbi:hypothetical protein ABENE_16870 [Asticcacaulis benevestitus DSM 16100 = ATCC BAA-896]|uniref:Uncharacterized protein n=2 Tax=Asticcacaulis TaxID=76890 RepID=V4PQM6_9CAUL|nr:hypothetical protein ABENE_16870 [Asticcacaulis benevestitus DSM 16100 = ATCC BAA-896]